MPASRLPGGSARGHGPSRASRAEVLAFEFVGGAARQLRRHLLQLGEVERCAAADAPEESVATDAVEWEPESVEHRSERLVDQVRVHLPEQRRQDAGKHLADPGGGQVGVGVRRVEAVAVVVGSRRGDRPRLDDPERSVGPCPLDVLRGSGERLDAARLAKGCLDLGGDVRVFVERIEQPGVRCPFAGDEGLGEPVDRLDACRVRTRRPGRR